MEAKEGKKPAKILWRLQENFADEASLGVVWSGVAGGLGAPRGSRWGHPFLYHRHRRKDGLGLERGGLCELLHGPSTWASLYGPKALTASPHNIHEQLLQLKIQLGVARYLECECMDFHHTPPLALSRPIFDSSTRVLVRPIGQLSLTLII